jgi:catechol 2,3-dioxygenase-like lactoylglutathione lyase family enzyme
MNIPVFGLGLIADDVAATRDFYGTYFGFEVRADLGWFVTMGHGESDYELSIVASDHGSVPDTYPRGAGGGVLGLVVSDATAVYQRLRTDGHSFQRDLVDEPWGQRHFFVSDPSSFLIDCIEVIPPDPEWMKANGLQPGESNTT